MRSGAATCGPKRSIEQIFILDPIAVRLHYSWQPIAPIPFCWKLLEPRLFLISTSSAQAPSQGLSFLKTGQATAIATAFPERSAETRE